MTSDASNNSIAARTSGSDAASLRLSPEAAAGGPEIGRGGAGRAGTGVTLGGSDEVVAVAAADLTVLASLEGARAAGAAVAAGRGGGRV